MSHPGRPGNLQAAIQAADELEAARIAELTTNVVTRTPYFAGVLQGAADTEGIFSVTSRTTGNTYGLEISRTGDGAIIGLLVRVRINGRLLAEQPVREMVRRLALYDAGNGTIELTAI
jgi:hypothetical protein